MTFNSVLKNEINSFLELNKISWASYTFKHYKCTLQNFDNWMAINNLGINDINDDLIQRWSKTLFHLSSSTKAQYLAQIKKFLDYLNILEIIQRINIVYPKHTSNYIPHFFSDDEITDIFNIADNIKPLKKNNTLKHELMHIEIPMVLRILYGTGARIGETLNLKVKDIDFDKAIIKFTHDTKNNKQRLVPVDKTLIEILAKYVMAMNINNHPDKFLFPISLKDNHLSAVVKDVSQVFRLKILPGLSLRDNLSWHQRGVCIHSFRHTFAFKSFKQNSNYDYSLGELVPYLSIYLGHESLNETEKYLKFYSVMYPETVKKFEAYSNCLFPEIMYEEE